MKSQLLACLVSRATPKGLALVHKQDLADALRLPMEDIDRLLQELVQAGDIDILSGPSFLVLRLRTWSGSMTKAPKTSGDRGRAYSSQSSLSRSKPIDESYSPADGRPSTDPLLQELLTTLGETDPTTFRQALRHYPRETILLALQRVRRRQPRNRTAFFRFLLPRLGKERPSTDHFAA